MAEDEPTKLPSSLPLVVSVAIIFAAILVLRQLALSPPGPARLRGHCLMAMIEDIRSIKKGAFRPLAENPVVHFLLIPSGGVGLLTLLAYLLPT